MKRITNQKAQQTYRAGKQRNGKRNHILWGAILLLFLGILVTGLGILSGSFTESSGAGITRENLSGILTDIFHGKDHTDIPAESSGLRIYYLDVGEADAALVQCDGRNMLIDGGNVSDSSFLYRFLKEHQADHLDAVVATHAHEDHVGGLAGALNYATADNVYCSVTEYDSNAFRSFKKYVEQQNCSITVPEAGDTFRMGSAMVTVLGPLSGDSATDANENNRSLILRIVYGETSFLFTGDAENAEEQAVLASGCMLESNVLKVAHHGSSDSTGYLWLRTVQPEYAIISVGSNDYGHPTMAVLSRLEDAEVQVYRTDLQGTILCESDGRHITFTPEKTEGPASSDVTANRIPGSGSENGTVSETVYVLNNSSRKFHKPDCDSVTKMSEKNRESYTGSRDALLVQGYEPCGRCKP